MTVTARRFCAQANSLEPDHRRPLLAVGDGADPVRADAQRDQVVARGSWRGGRPRPGCARGCRARRHGLRSRSPAPTAGSGTPPAGPASPALPATGRVDRGRRTPGRRSPPASARRPPATSSPLDDVAGAGRRRRRPLPAPAPPMVSASVDSSDGVEQAAARASTAATAIIRICNICFLLRMRPSSVAATRSPGRFGSAAGRAEPSAIAVSPTDGTVLGLHGCKGDHAGSEASSGVTSRARCTRSGRWNRAARGRPSRRWAGSLRKNISTRPLGAQVGPSTWKPSARIRSPQPSGRITPMEKLPPLILVKAIRSPRGDQTGVT